MKVRFLLPLLFYFHQKMLRVPINAGFVGIFFFVAAQIFVGIWRSFHIVYRRLTPGGKSSKIIIDILSSPLIIV